MCAAAGCGSLSFGSQLAAAEPGKVPTRLDWGTSVCGDAEGFSSRVLKRTQRVRFVESGERLTVRLSIAPQGDGLDARVVLQTPGRPDVVRHIASPDCDDALDALALVVAISLEAQSQEIRVAPKPPPRRPPSRARPKPAPQPAPAQPVPPEVSVEPDATDVPVAPEPVVPAVPPEPPAPPPEPPASSAPVPATKERPQLEAAPPPPPANVENDRAPELDTGPSTPSETEGLGLAGGVSAHVLLGVAPEAMIGGQAWLGVSWERESIWSPGLTLSYAHHRRDGYVQEGEGEANFELNAVSLGLCPLRLGSATLHVRPCAVGSRGRLGVSGHRTFSAQDHDLRWVTLGGELQGVARAGLLELRASVGVTGPLIRDRFRFGPPGECDDETACEGVFHRADAALWMAGAGAGITFW